MGIKEREDGLAYEEQQPLQEFAREYLTLSEVIPTPKALKHLTKSDWLVKAPGGTYPHGISVKSPIGRNLQVFLTTAKQVSNILSLSSDETRTLTMWLGTNSSSEYTRWERDFIGKNCSHGQEYMRARAAVLPHWQGFLEKMNLATQNGSLLVRLFQAFENDPYLSTHLVWYDKKKSLATILDFEILIDHIRTHCHWELSTSKTGEFNLWCVDRSQPGRHLLSLQSKGSIITQGPHKGGRSRDAMFHLLHFWPRAAVIKQKYLEIVLPNQPKKTTLERFLKPASFLLQRKRAAEAELDRVMNSDFEEEEE